MPAEPTMLLVHSPLLTTATWDAIRPHLEAAGWRVGMEEVAGGEVPLYLYRFRRA